MPAVREFLTDTRMLNARTLNARTLSGRKAWTAATQLTSSGVTATQR